jgi:hypothetical protein
LSQRLLRRVQELAPGSVWAQRADEALRTPATVFRLRRWAALYLGIDYDSNVVLRGDGVSLPTDVSNQGDGLVWWGIEAGTEVFRTDDWGGGILGNYYGNAHFSEHDFDQDWLYAAFWIDRTLGESTLLRVQPEFGQGFYDYDDYVRFYGVLVEVLHDWGAPGQGTFYARYDYNNYQYRIPGNPALASTRNRDGNSVRTGYDHFYAIDQDTAVRGGPYFLYYAAAGSEYDSWGVGGWAEVERKLTVPELLWNDGFVRKSLIIIFLATAWEIYGTVLDNPLLFPTFHDTILTMFDKVRIRTLGLVENMSYFLCPDNGKRYDIFGTGGGEAAARELGVDFLGRVPHLGPEVATVQDIDALTGDQPQPKEKGHRRVFEILRNAAG